jgi:hypothetical protein
MSPCVTFRSVSVSDILRRFVEHLKREAVRIGSGLQHEWWHGGDEDRFRDSLGPVAADIACNFPPPVE